VLQSSAPLDRAFQALADPTRRIMVERLSRSPASVSELARPLDMTLSAVVQHLAVLEASGLVRSEKVGRVRTCRIEPAALRSAERWISERGRAGNAASIAWATSWPRPNFGETAEGKSEQAIDQARHLHHRAQLCRAAGARVCRLPTPRPRRAGSSGRTNGRSRTSSSISRSAAAKA
jgi:Predicted transcriptional regulators